jgi:transcriptional regulator with GAF, ATPase, and Fis domain
MTMMPHELKISFITEKITKITASLYTLPDESKYLDNMLSVLMEFSMATGGAYIIVDDDKLSVILNKNMGSDFFIADRFAPCRKVIMNSVKTDSEVIISAEHNRIGKPFMEAGIHSFFGIPVKTKKRDHGYLLLCNRLGGEPFTENILSFVRMICSQLAVGLTAFSLQEEVEDLKEQLNPAVLSLNSDHATSDPISIIIGESKGIKFVKDQVRQVAETDSAVVVLGETGVGKELVAKAIHQLSNRNKGPFIPVSIAALPEELVANELFGHEKGSFTGAHVQSKGRFEFANGGTIFLDEIGDLSIRLQVKLLRVLQEGAFERIGSSKLIQSDFRVIAATNKNLVAEIEKGAFREDLYYRLNVFPIKIPPLRERDEDLFLLAEYFIDYFAKKMGKKVKVSKGELKKLSEYDWPGNVRELKHFLEKAVILYDGHGLSLAGFGRRSDINISSDGMRFYSLADMEKAYIIKVLKATSYHIKGANGAAAILGVAPSTLYYRMKKLDIKRNP